MLQLKRGRRDSKFSISLAILISIACGLNAKVLQVEELNYGQLIGQWRLTFDGVNGESSPTKLYIYDYQEQNISISISEVVLTGDADFYFKPTVDATKTLWIADLNITKAELQPMASNSSLGEWHGLCAVRGLHLGYALLHVDLHRLATTDNTAYVERNPNALEFAVLRNQHLDDKIFAYTAPALVLLMFINLGTVLDLKRLRAILLRPIGPVVSVCARYILMPTLGLALGMLFFSNNKYLLIGLFYTALSPSGGLANVCAVFLKGNINLSIAATTINSLFALAMLPLWIFVLMEIAPADSNLTVPYLDLGIGSVALVLAITLGVLLRVFFPKTTNYIFRFLKPLSMVLSLCLVGLTVGINIYIFERITVMIMLAAFMLPSFGYALTYFLSRTCRMPKTDSLTIAIETSVLNMTVPIMLLQQSFEKPQSDMIIVVPIMSALVSLFLVLILYVVRRAFGWNKADEHGFCEKKLLSDKEVLIVE